MFVKTNSSFQYRRYKDILNFDIHHINKNLKIKNKLIDKETSYKFLKKVKKINQYYSNFKK